MSGKLTAGAPKNSICRWHEGERQPRRNSMQAVPESPATRGKIPAVLSRLLTMQIILNGTPTSVPVRPTLAALLASLQLAGQRLAVELNGGIVPRSRWSEVYVAEGDRIEIVKAIGGG